RSRGQCRWSFRSRLRFSIPPWLPAKSCKLQHRAQTRPFAHHQLQCLPRLREDNRFVHSFMKRTDGMPTIKKQEKTNTGQGEIAPARGKLGVMIPGMGAVATTFVAGVEAVREGISNPIGSLTQMGTIRLGK